MTNDPIEWGIDAPVEPESAVLDRNTSGGLVGLQPYPDTATNSEADISIDSRTMFINDVTCAPDVIRSYSETFAQAYQGEMYEDGNHTMQGGGAPLPDQTLGPDRNGYRGMSMSEDLPVRPPKPDDDNDYDGDTASTGYTKH